MGLTLPLTVLASILRTVGPDRTGADGVGWGAAGVGAAAALACEAPGVTTLGADIPSGMISIALICGFSTFGVKTTLILPSVALTLTVSTYARIGPPALTQTSKSLKSCPWTLKENTR